MQRVVDNVRTVTCFTPLRFATRTRLYRCPRPSWRLQSFSSSSVIPWKDSRSYGREQFCSGLRICLCMCFAFSTNRTCIIMPMFQFSGSSMLTCLSSSPIVQITFLTGILAPIFHVAFRNTASLALPCIFVISGVSLLIHIPSLLLVNRRISHIEKEDSLRRQRVSFTPANLWPERFGSQKSASNNSFGSGRQSVKRSLLPDDAIHLPEDEAQRQQLLKLLLKKENESRPPVVTGPQGGGVQTTYRVDIPVPDDSESVTRRDLSLLTTFSPSKSFPTWNHPSSESNTYGSTWQSGNVIGSDTYRSEESQDSVPSLQHKSDSPINVRMGSNHNRETSFLSTGSNSEYSTYQSRNEPEPQPQPQWQTPLPKLQQTPSQVDRERRRREIELGESRLLPSYSGNGITESHRDSKVTWGSRHG